ncbi:MAG: indole-3-glycerol phosphate synthase TrpC [Armatimonadetes bacterium]|nr:indole-3-glycerol phosphate synthase TrpC [Armatimonadota bacterium]
MPSILETIIAHKRREVAARREAVPAFPLAAAPPPRDFAAALQGEQVRLIAEAKAASPSRGTLRTDFDPVSLAETYAAHGAAAISMLTDTPFFRGHNDYLSAARARVPVPILRKDFILDPWQIEESRAIGADAILLIAAVLAIPQLREFAQRAAALGMACLVEAHTEVEVEAALQSGARVIGINNRNLHTFETTLETTERLAGVIKSAGDRILVSESGIFTAADVARVAAAGADAVLVGEALVREADVGAKVRELASVTRNA